VSYVLDVRNDEALFKSLDKFLFFYDEVSFSHLRDFVDTGLWFLPKKLSKKKKFMVRRCYFFANTLIFISLFQ